DLLERGLGDVYAGDVLRAAGQGVDAEAAGVGEQVEHPAAAAVLAQQLPVLALVEERSALLAVQQVDLEAQTVLAHRQPLRRSLAPQRSQGRPAASFAARRGELLARRSRILRDALHDPAQPQPRAAHGSRYGSDLSQTAGVAPNHRVAAVAIDDQARQPVAFTVHQAVRVGFAVHQA